MNNTMSFPPSAVFPTEDRREMRTNTARVDNNSRWATWSEVKSALDEVEFGTTGEVGGPVLYNDGKRALIDSKLNHVLVIGPTGAGKSVSFANPSIDTISRSGESLLVIDTKGQAYQDNKRMLTERGYKQYHINIRKLNESDGFNPLATPYRFYCSEDLLAKDRAFEMIDNFAAALFPLQPNVDPFWQLSARSLFIGLTLLLFKNCYDSEKVNLRSVVALRYELSNESPFFLHMYEELPVDSGIRQKLSVCFENAEQTKRCILSMFDEGIGHLASQEMLSRLMSVNDIDFSSLGREPTVLFMTVPDERSTYDCLVTTLIDQCYEQLVWDAHELYGGALPVRTTMIIDEFGNLPKISNMGKMITATRSRNIRLILIVQCQTQLEYKYGADMMEVIFSNCRDIVFLMSREGCVLERISELAGRDSTGRPLVSKSALQHLPIGQAIVFQDRLHPFVTTLTACEGSTECDCQEKTRELTKVKVFGPSDLYGLDLRSLMTE